MSPVYINRVKELGCELWIKDGSVFAVFNSIKECWDNCDKVEEIAMDSDSNWTIDVVSMSILSNREGLRRAIEEELLSY